MKRSRNKNEEAAGASTTDEAVDSIVAMIEYLIPDVENLDPVASYCLRLSRERLAFRRRIAEGRCICCGQFDGSAPTSHDAGPSGAPKKRRKAPSRSARTNPQSAGLAKFGNCHPAGL